MDFGGFNSAEKTPTLLSFSSMLDISSAFEIHLHQRHCTETLFHRNMRMVQRVIRRFTAALKGLCLEREHSIQRLYAT